MIRSRKGLFALLVASLCAFSLISPAAPVHAGNGFFEKIGDGWKHGKWVPGIPHVKPKTWQEVIFPVCWGSPQDCRDDAKKQDQRTSGGPQPLVSVSYRVNCRDRDTGGNRADSTVTVTASTRAGAVAEIERLARSTDLCQGTGDLSRVTIPGSGRYLD